ncbi:MAG: hypothetical protein HZC40_00900 [Chloroflexi bacterium]|nr:hypothetical protein [Chloroflexota bacterium]
MYHLFPQSDLSLPMLQPPNEPDAIEFYDASTRRGIVFLFRGTVAWSERRVVLRALAPNVVYDVQTSDGVIKLRRTGRQLMSDKIEFTFEQERPSALLFITPAPSGATPEPLPNP